MLLLKPCTRTRCCQRHCCPWLLQLLLLRCVTTHLEQHVLHTSNVQVSAGKLAVHNVVASLGVW